MSDRDRTSTEVKALAQLGATARKHRQAARLTQAQLAEATGLHRTYIASFERGERNPSFLTLAKIARGLGVSVVELLSRVQAFR